MLLAASSTTPMSRPPRVTKKCETMCKTLSCIPRSCTLLIIETYNRAHRPHIPGSYWRAALRQLVHDRAVHILNLDNAVFILTCQQPRLPQILPSYLQASPFLPPKRLTHHLKQDLLPYNIQHESLFRPF